MGGMFTVVKVSDGISSYEDSSWHDHPRGTVAWKVDDGEPARPAAVEPEHHHGD